MPLKFFHPKYWLIWLGIALLRLIVLLPWGWQMSIGKGLGKLLYAVSPSRRKVSCVNLSIAFSSLSPKETTKLNKAHFVSLGQSLMDSALSWWGSDAQVKQLTHIEGFEHYQKAISEGRIMFVGAHFNSMEIGGRIFSAQAPVHAVYRPHQNELLEYIVAKKRTEQYGKTISKYKIREMIKSIKNGDAAWYATDQNYREKGSMLIPFFGVDAPTNPSTHRLSKIMKAKVIPVFTMRLMGNGIDQRKGYLLRFLPPLENFPTDGEYQDVLRLNHIIEEQIREYPPQYLWSHKRYKHYASENKDFYKDYLLNHETGCS
jgi:KDO2-lipid IV(A) lauroyltransferase